MNREAYVRRLVERLALRGASSSHVAEERALLATHCEEKGFGRAVLDLRSDDPERRDDALLALLYLHDGCVPVYRPESAFELGWPPLLGFTLDVVPFPREAAVFTRGRAFRFLVAGAASKALKDGDVVDVRPGDVVLVPLSMNLGWEDSEPRYRGYNLENVLARMQDGRRILMGFRVAPTGVEAAPATWEIVPMDKKGAAHKGALPLEDLEAAVGKPELLGRLLRDGIVVVDVAGEPPGQGSLPGVG